VAGARESAPRAVLDDSDPALFPKLTDEPLALFAPLGRVHTITIGDVLFREGDHGGSTISHARLGAAMKQRFASRSLRDVTGAKVL
jgi:hypothetical protein